MSVRGQATFLPPESPQKAAFFFAAALTLSARQPRSASCYGAGSSPRRSPAVPGAGRGAGDTPVPPHLARPRGPSAASSIPRDLPSSGGPRRPPRDPREAKAKCSSRQPRAGHGAPCPRLCPAQLGSGPVPGGAPPPPARWVPAGVLAARAPRLGAALGAPRSWALLLPGKVASLLFSAPSEALGNISFCLPRCLFASPGNSAPAFPQPPPLCRARLFGDGPGGVLGQTPGPPAGCCCPRTEPLTGSRQLGKRWLLTFKPAVAWP